MMHQGILVTANISHPVVRDEQLYVLIMRRVCVLRWGNLGTRLGFTYIVLLREEIIIIGMHSFHMGSKC